MKFSQKTCEIVCSLDHELRFITICQKSVSPSRATTFSKYDRHIKLNEIKNEVYILLKEKSISNTKRKETTTG